MTAPRPSPEHDLGWLLLPLYSLWSHVVFRPTPDWPHYCVLGDRAVSEEQPEIEGQGVRDGDFAH